jgi:hypothetical protein
MRFLAQAVASVPSDVKPRIAGIVYDWDLWPLRIAAGAGPLSFEMARLNRDLVAFSQAFGLSFYEVTRGFSKFVT